MSLLLERIKVDQLTARKAADSVKATLLTTLLGEASPSGKDTVTDDQIEAVVKKFAKNIKETLPFVSSVDKRNVLNQELEILQDYLPEQITGAELENLIDELIKSLNCSNMGQVMQNMNKSYKGKFDGKEASTIAKSLLNAG